MQYKLENGCSSGILIDRTSILKDIRDTCTVSFLLPDSEQYIAIFIDENGLRHQCEIKSGNVSIPHELLKQQVVQLYVGKIKNNICCTMFSCGALRIQAFNDMVKSYFEITGIMTEEDLRIRIAELEQAFCTQMQKYEEVKERFATLSEKYNNAVLQYNAAVETVNKMNERLTALEANYDPTIIE
jgi:hypothetical protein